MTRAPLTDEKGIVSFRLSFRLTDWVKQAAGARGWSMNEYVARVLEVICSPPVTTRSATRADLGSRGRARATASETEEQHVGSLWTVAEVAAYLRVSRSWVYHRSAAGLLPCLRVGALLRFEPDAIRAYARGQGHQDTNAVILNAKD